MQLHVNLNPQSQRASYRRRALNGIYYYMEYIYAKKKNDCTAGTFESSAFILSLKDEEEFSTLHSYGYHRVPIIGN